MEIHIKKPTDKKAKTVAMLAALPPAVYDGLWSEVGGAATHGGADLRGWHRTPRKLLSAWAYQEDGRSWGRPMKRWAESFEEDLKGASIPVSKWHKLAQDKENWKDLISEIGEESKKSKAKKKRKRQWNPLASCGTGCTGK